MKRFALLALLAPLACTGQQTPCSGSTCLDVAGSYTFVLGGSVSCSLWENQVPPSSLMTIAQGSDPSQLTVTLWPTTGNPQHVLSGTLYANGSMSVAENSQNTRIGVPFATITGVFQGNDGTSAPPFYFDGQIFLQGGNPSASSGGAGGAAGGGTPIGGGNGGGMTTGLACNGSTSFTAEQAAGSYGTTGGTGGTGTGTGTGSSSGSGGGGSSTGGHGSTGAGSTGGAASSSGSTGTSGGATGGSSGSGGTT